MLKAMYGARSKNQQSLIYVPAHPPQPTCVFNNVCSTAQPLPRKPALLDQATLRKNLTPSHSVHIDLNRVEPL